jgi:hypothetical protein
MLERKRGAYGNAAETALFLDSSKPSYIGATLEMANDRRYPLRDRSPRCFAADGGAYWAAIVCSTSSVCLAISGPEPDGSTMSSSTQA